MSACEAEWTGGDIVSALVRSAFALLGPAGALAGEFVSSPSERQMRRAIATLQRLFAELRDEVTEEMWKRAQNDE